MVLLGKGDVCPTLAGRHCLSLAVTLQGEIIINTFIVDIHSHQRPWLFAKEGFGNLYPSQGNYQQCS